MPSRLETPVLALDAAKLKEVDPRNVESLYSLWSMFKQCSHSLKDGRRLENMSWRLWARETLCCPPQPDKAIVPQLDLAWQNQVPSLSNSVASDDEEEEILDEATQTVTGDDQAHLPIANDSALSKSRGHETHLSADTLKKIVIGIQAKHELGPLSPSLEASLPPLKSLGADPSTGDDGAEAAAAAAAAATTTTTTCGSRLRESTESCVSRTTVATMSTNASRSSDHRSSDTSVSSDGLIRSGSVVHGFSPASTSFRAKAMQGMPMPPPSKTASQPSKRPNMFQLGASSEEEESSFETKASGFVAASRTPEAATSSSKLQTQRPLEKKTTSFRDIVEQRRRDSEAGDDEGAIASSDDDEDDESAIEEEDDDDDDDGWEDSPSDEEKPVAPEKYQFRRVESRANMVSRPSMLSMQLEQKQRALSMQNANSRSQPAFLRTRTTTVNVQALATSPEDPEDEQGLVMQSSRARARPIIITQPAPQPAVSQAHSPRTTRRNMLASELGESLRKNLLWERQQKSQTVNAFLKRSRNAQSMANLQGAAAAAATAPTPQWTNRQSWNNEFENPWEFNAKGW